MVFFFGLDLIRFCFYPIQKVVFSPLSMLFSGWTYQGRRGSRKRGVELIIVGQKNGKKRQYYAQCFQKPRFILTSLVDILDIFMINIVCKTRLFYKNDKLFLPAREIPFPLPRDSPLSDTKIYWRGERKLCKLQSRVENTFFPAIFFHLFSASRILLLLLLRQRRCLFVGYLAK